MVAPWLVSLEKAASGERVKALCVLVSVATILGATKIAFAESWAVKAEELECLVQNLEAYHQAPVDPVIIVLGGCPEVDPTAAFASIAQNSAVSEVRIENDDAQKPAEIIILDKSSLDCLAPYLSDTTNGIVTLPENPCK